MKAIRHVQLLDSRHIIGAIEPWVPHIQACEHFVRIGMLVALRTHNSTTHSHVTLRGLKLTMNLSHTARRRRPRNRPSIHPRFINVRQQTGKAYRQKKLARGFDDSFGSAYCDGLACFIYAVLGLLIASFSTIPYASGYGVLLVCYSTFSAARLAMRCALPNISDAWKFFGIDGS